MTSPHYEKPLSKTSLPWLGCSKDCRPIWGSLPTSLALKSERKVLHPAASSSHIHQGLRHVHAVADEPCDRVMPEWVSLPHYQVSGRSVDHWRGWWTTPGRRASTSPLHRWTQWHGTGGAMGRWNSGRQLAGDRGRVQGRRYSRHEGGAGEGADYLGGGGQVLRTLHLGGTQSRVRPFCRILWYWRYHYNFVILVSIPFSYLITIKVKKMDEFPFTTQNKKFIFYRDHVWFSSVTSSISFGSCAKFTANISYSTILNFLFPPNKLLAFFVSKEYLDA